MGETAPRVGLRGEQYRGMTLKPQLIHSRRSATLPYVTSRSSEHVSGSYGIPCAGYVEEQHYTENLEGCLESHQRPSHLSRLAELAEVCVAVL